MMNDSSFDLLALGRVGVDLYPQQDGPLEQVRTFAKSLGGSAANVAVAAARLGRRVALVSKVGDDPFGRYLRSALTDFGVDTRFVGTSSEYKTPLTFAELDPREEPGLEFYREPVAPDLTLESAELDRQAIENAAVLWVTGTGFSLDPSREATMQALRWRRAAPKASDGRAARVTVFDLDWRAHFWRDPGLAAQRYAAVVPLADVVIGNRAEVSVALHGSDRPLPDFDADAAADELLARGVQIAVVKLGADGVLVATASHRHTVPPVTVDVVCGLGAGDAFGGAFVHGLLAGWPLERTARFANAAGAYVAGRLACADEMPRAEEVEAILTSEEATT